MLENYKVGILEASHAKTLNQVILLRIIPTTTPLRR
jgi:hypothetical protein